MNTDDTRELCGRSTPTSRTCSPHRTRSSKQPCGTPAGRAAEINVSPNEGRLLQLLTEIAGARRILEIGTLGGYSAIQFARALPEDGDLISLEIDEHHAGVARNNVERAGLSEKVEIRVGDAHELLASLIEDDEGPFDMIFIDADKESYPSTSTRPCARTTRLSHPRRQHHKGRHRTRPQGRNGQGDARVQRADSQRPKALQHRATPDPGAHRRPDHSTGPVGAIREPANAYRPCLEAGPFADVCYYLIRLKAFEVRTSSGG